MWSHTPQIYGWEPCSPHGPQVHGRALRGAQGCPGSIDARIQLQLSSELSMGVGMRHNEEQNRLLQFQDHDEQYKKAVHFIYTEALVSHGTDFLHYGRIILPLVSPNNCRSSCYNSYSTTQSQRKGEPKHQGKSENLIILVPWLPWSQR